VGFAQVEVVTLAHEGGIVASAIKSP